MKKIFSLFAAVLMAGSMMAANVLREAAVVNDTVFFVNAADWDAVKAYAWGGTGASMTWPGLDATKADYQLKSKDVYYFVAAQGAYGKCIFNNGAGAQTDNLDWTAGKYYYNGLWKTRAELESVGPDPEPTTNNYYLVGTLAENGWNTATAMPMPGDSIDRSLAAGTYEFKILTTLGSWDGALGFGSVNAECSSQGYEDNGGNVKVTLAEAGEVKVKVVGGQICVVGSFGEAVITVYTIAGDAALMGVNWDPAAVANDMTENEGTWTLVKTDVELTAKSYEYKVLANHTWGVSDYPAQGNATLSIAEAATYDITFTWIPAENSLTATANKKGQTTGLENVKAAQAVKVIENGQVVILREGLRYTTTGQIIK